MYKTLCVERILGFFFFPLCLFKRISDNRAIVFFFFIVYVRALLTSALDLSSLNERYCCLLLSSFVFGFNPSDTFSFLIYFLLCLCIARVLNFIIDNRIGCFMYFYCICRQCYMRNSHVSIMSFTLSHILSLFGIPTSR